ncbi:MULTISPECIES: hypothetical protein [Emticicia]|uniref:hypothetical protein n=1 Tax=Emticicia TaxID=312278 RepID=UPI0007D8A872|nr:MULTISPECIES: hypothetical protein [Emticicia]
MNFKILTVAITLVVGTLFSCKKSETAAPKTKTELLAGTTSKSWKNTKAVAANGGLSIDLVSTQPTCVVDNILTFYSNKSYEIREGATKCNSADPDLVLKANWSLNSDETKFTVDKIIFQGRQFDNITFDVVQLTEDIFVGKTMLTISNVSYEFSATFEPVK